MKLKTILNFFPFFFSCFCVFGQDESHQVRMDSTKYLCTELVTNANDEFAGIYLDLNAINSSNLYIVDFSGPITEIQKTYRFHFISQPPFFRNLIWNKYKYQNNQLFISHSLGMSGVPHLLFSMNMETETFWYKGISADSWFGFDEQNNSAVLAANDDSSQSEMNLLSVDADTGDELWSIGYKTTDLQNNPLSSGMTDFHINADEGYFIGGILSKQDSVGNYISEAFILNTDDSGVPIKWKKFNHLFIIQNIYTSSDAVYLLSRTEQDYPFNENGENLLLVKLDFDLNIVWSKVFHAEEFEFKNASLSVADDGTLTLGYSTFGYFPTILAKLNPQGEILWQKGYPLYQPELDQFSDGSMLMLSRVRESADSLVNIIAKTDTLGNIEGCETFEACLESTDITLTTGLFNIETVDAYWDTLEIDGLLMDTVQFSFSDYCEFPTPPMPDFYLPDTICIMDSVSTTGMGNEHAHGIRWHLSGSNMDSIWIDSLVFRHRFMESDTYTLTQFIWYLGCEHSFQRTVTVLPALDISIETDSNFCEPPANLYVQSNRGVKSYLWSSGESSEMVEVQQDGLYGVSVNDGYCNARDSMDIGFVSPMLNGLPPLHLPQDTVVCETALPYLLSPVSDFSDVFLFENVEQEIPIQINDAGKFEIAVSIEDCLFSEVFELEVEDCGSAIYFPTVFSPNGDGVNDIFFPQGKNYIPTRLLVFDRWGGLVYKQEGANVSWDGKEAGVGVYTYVFEYLATQDGKEGRVYGAITLIK